MPTFKQIAHRRTRHRSNTKVRVTTPHGPRIIWRNPVFELRENANDKVTRPGTPMLCASFDDQGGHATYADGEIRVFAFA